MATASAKAASTKAATTDTRRRLLVEPDITGPRVRMGVLWFLLAMAAVTSGRMWISLLLGAVSALAGYQITKAWGPPRRKRKKGTKRSRGEDAIKVDARVAAGVAGVVPLLAGYSTGAAGAGLILAPILVIGYHATKGGTFPSAVPTLFGAIAPALAAVPIVLTVRLNLWAGLFLIMAVSLYDAGSFLYGSGAGARWEGPVAGVIGILAVTFTMAVFHPNPFTPVSVALSGAILAVACPLGQIMASKFLPVPDAKARGLRRLDAYLVAAPVFYICATIITS